MLRIENLSISFRNGLDTTQAVDHISFQLQKGAALGLVGESGSGKSVTALSIMRLLGPQAIIESGTITFNEMVLNDLDDAHMRQLLGSQIAMIFQEPMTALNPVIRCGKQVAESILRHQKISKADAMKQVIELFKTVKLPRPESIYRSYPHQISGGQKQRVMIAMAVANKPQLLIADEPTTALDVTVQKEIISLLRELREQFNMALLFISHDLGVVAEVADEVAVMYKGKIVEAGSTTTVFRNPQHPYTKGLMACRPPLRGKPHRLPTIEEFTENTPTIDEDTQKGKRSSEDNRKTDTSILEVKPVMQVDNLVKSYPIERKIFRKTEYVHAVDKVSFKVYPGETLGLVGESGCGKTTLSRAILRLIQADSGEIYFNEQSLLNLKSKGLKKLRKSLNIVFQDPYASLNPRISIGSAIMEPMQVHHLYQNNKERRKKALELLSKVGLPESSFNRYPHEFSGGQRQRIVIARALALNPRFIICDEAVSALDVSVQAKVLNLLNDLKADFGFTYIFISHDLSVVRYMSDRIMVMKDGQIVELGEADALYYNPKTEYTKQLIASIPVLDV